MKHRVYFIITIVLLVKIEISSAHRIKRKSKIASISGAEDSFSSVKTIPKCCGPNEAIAPGKKCINTTEAHGRLDFSEVPLYDKNQMKTGKSLEDVYSFVTGKFSNETFKNNSFNYLQVEHRYYLTEDKILYQEIPNELHRWNVLDVDHFCIDYLIFKRASKKPEARFWTILSSTQEFNHDDPFITTGLLISCVFMTLVLLVYCVLPELRNIGGLVLMAYVGSLLGAFLILATLQIGHFTVGECKGLTYLTYFFFLASFCWMTVMSCDIWWTFRGYAKARPIHRRGEKFKFAMYCIYAFGLPIAMTVMLGILDNMDMRHVPWVITPKIPSRTCFIGDDAKLFYLYIPMLILILSNWAFFLMTAFNIWRLHRITAVLDSAAAGTPAAHRKQRHRLMIYLKLSIIMGINWVMEVVSSFQPHLKVWYLSDLYNVLIGLSIFLIFVCKRKIFRMLCKKYRGWNKSWQSRSQYSKSRSSHTTDSDVSQDTAQVCLNPKGPVYVVIKS